MIAMKDFINNIKIGNNVFYSENIKKKEINCNNNSLMKPNQNDVFKKEKDEKNKNNKKRNVIIAAVLAAIAAAVAFIKRKDVLNFFSRISKKHVNTDTKTKEQIFENIAKKQEPVVSAAPKVQEFVDKNVSKMTSKEFYKELSKSDCTSEKVITLIKQCTETGIDDIDTLASYLNMGNDEISMAVIKFYEKWGTPKSAVLLTDVIPDDKTALTGRSELYQEALKAIQKLADVSSYTEDDKEICFYEPIKNLLNHSDEKVRALAKETLEKLQKRK